jgi:hypothetical protein
MQTAQGAAALICEHYYPNVARKMPELLHRIQVRQGAKVLENPAYNVYEDKDFCEDMANCIGFHFFEDVSKHERNQQSLIIWYAYPEVGDTGLQDFKLPKDSLNRIFILLERYNKAIKRKGDLNMKKILRGVVLNDVLEPVAEADPVNTPLSG